ncbi:hypothetical protein J5X84_00440 [Streptosporangiaceae bacterium NEAU-GS5]|nr:hypothetical protein [Streptosporangiaceae bacterium NEAU-GS5]
MFVFAYLLGVSWLLLSPVCVWLLFARGYAKLVRAAAAATLAALEGATIALAYVQAPPTTPVAAPAAVSTPVPGSVSAPAVVAAPSAGGAPCPVMLPKPQSVRLTRDGTRLSELTIYWPASAHECGTAAVLVRHQGHRLRIWLHEGALPGQHGDVTTRPVHVDGHTAALDLRLPAPLPARPRHLLAVDGRTGHPIPLTH